MYFLTLISKRIIAVLCLVFVFAFGGAQTINTNSLPQIRPYAGETPLTFQPKKSVSRKADTSASALTVMCDEDFSRWTLGTEDLPDSTWVVSTEWYIPDSLMAQPGWTGYTVLMGGGCCALASPVGYGGGSINTPVGDYSGHVTLTFRAKTTRGKTKANVCTALARGFSNPVLVDGGFFEYLKATSEWQTFTVECECTYSGSDAYVQINTYDNIVIDDVKVTCESTVLASPKLESATEYTNGGFTANWQTVRGADQYLLSVFSERITSDEDIVACSLPGHTFTADNDTIETDYNGGLIQTFVIDYDVLSDEDFTSEHVSIGTFGFQGWDGFKWSNDLFYGYCNKRHREVDYNDELAGNYYKIRIISYNMDNHIVRFNSINYTTTTPTERIYMLKDKVVEGTSYVVDGLDPEEDYIYYVVARNSETGLTSGDPTSCTKAYSLPAPVVTEATDISRRGGYTANWEVTPKADEYLVENYAVYTATEEEPSHIIINDDFSAIDFGGATADNPYYAYNTSLNEIEGGTNQAGWYVYLGAFIDGAIGAMGIPEYGIGGEVQTPEFSSHNNDGVYDVTMTCQGTSGDYLRVANLANVGGYILLDGTWQTFEFSLDCGQEHDILGFASYDHNDFFISDITITTRLQSGEEVHTYLSKQYVEGQTNTSARFSDLQKDDNISFAYNVYGYHTTHGSTYRSVRSSMQAVDVYGTGIEDVNADQANRRTAVHYNLLGQPVGSDAKGIVIESDNNGKLRKVLKR